MKLSEMYDGSEDGYWYPAVTLRGPTNTGEHEFAPASVHQGEMPDLTVENALYHIQQYFLACKRAAEQELLKQTGEIDDEDEFHEEHIHDSLSISLQMIHEPDAKATLQDINIRGDKVVYQTRGGYYQRWLGIQRGIEKTLAATMRDAALDRMHGKNDPDALYKCLKATLNEFYRLATLTG